MPNNNLNKSINDIQFDLDFELDQKFREQAKKIGIHTLNDVMEMSLSSLKAHPDFTYLWFAALLQILEDEDLLDAFQAKLY